jgi:hypothetical protein
MAGPIAGTETKINQKIDFWQAGVRPVHGRESLTEAN